VNIAQNKKTQQISNNKKTSKTSIKNIYLKKKINHKRIDRSRKVKY